MRTIVVVSDSHGLTRPLKLIRAAYQQADLFVHCGDTELADDQLSGFVSVRGNNDIFTDFPDEQVISLGSLKVYVTHGHRFYYRTIPQEVAKRAAELGCQLACYGHTHCFYAQQHAGVLVMNPGSMRMNRDGTKPSYAVVTQNDDGSLHVMRHDVSDLTTL